MPTRTFDFTGGWVKWDVPKGVKTVDVTLEGGGINGRRGGKVIGKLRTTGKQTLFIGVGERGQANSGATGGGQSWGGGGAGGSGKGSGGVGGDGGAGASVIRLDAKDGPIRAVAGGAGGSSGDSGLGGRGGPDIGQYGLTGTSGTEEVSPATGGTQSQGGKGGTSGAGTSYYGRDGEQAKLGRGGKGASPDGARVHGGGGGGGGYYPGAGGQGSAIGVHPGGGGGGGSNYVGGLYSAVSDQGLGSLLDGVVTIHWLDPDDPNNPPVPPDDIRIDGQPIANGLATKALNNVTLAGTPDDPDAGQGVRLLVWMSESSTMTNHSRWLGTYDPTDHRDKVKLTGLQRNTRYYLRIYTQDKNHVVSTSYRTTNFWTNRPPDSPTLTDPSNNTYFTVLDNVTFEWVHHDPDPSDSQTAFRLRYRRAATPLVEPGPWTQIEATTSDNMRVVAAGAFKGNTNYEWQVQTRDEQEIWGAWSEAFSFFVTADATPPLLVTPVKNNAIVASEDYTFRWKFLNPVTGTLQDRADLRYRVVGTPDWITLTGDGVTPGDSFFWTIAAGTFEAGFNYEWQVRTYSDTGFTSDWSDSEFFWAIPAPSSGAGLDVIDSGEPQAPLGEGENEVYVYDRGGLVRRGRMPKHLFLEYNRVRDDFSTCTLRIAPQSEDDKALLRNIRTWRQELVIFRDGIRVWEGPLTRITDNSAAGYVEYEARDVWAYVYRRILRQGYNDSYQLVNGEQLGLRTVVERAQQIVMNCLAYDDPNVLPYLTPLHASTDARQSRVVADYQTMAWQDIDDMAAHSGLDYTAAGRRILLWDTHRPVGRLPEMRNGDFSVPPILTEYGMNLAVYFAVTNGSGIWGAASNGVVGGVAPPEGWVEQLALSYGESVGAVDPTTLTQEAKRRLQTVLSAQAGRNIANRYPTPQIVRIPDNSTLSPDLNIGINQLIPGVWIPLRVEGMIYEVAQWQKLDKVTVSETPDEGEKITVVMSPAPNAGEDPDAEAAIEETG